MENWVLTGPKTVVRQKQTKSTLSASQVKVRISHLLLSKYDALCFSGGVKLSYPRTPGRFAIGIITETGGDCGYAKKGDRVFLEAVRSCKRCLNCRRGNHAKCTDVQTVVRNFDGFLRDFIVCDYNDVTVIPDSVDDMHALCIENVALAENMFDKLNLSAGSRVAVIGAGFTGSIIAQIAQYHKLIPIVIDNYPKNIDRMKASGVYYAFTADDDLEANIAEATSGSMCDAVIYTTCSKLNSSIPARVAARNKNIVLCGFADTDFNFNAQPLFEKNLKIMTISDGYTYTEAAINMLVHGAIDLELFEKEIIPELKPEDLGERAEESFREAKMTVYKMIM